MVGLITMRDTKNSIGNDAKETLDQGGDISLRMGFDNKVIRFGHKRYERDNEESQLVRVNEQRNVTKDKDSFDTKPARAESVTTPMDLTTSAMPMCPQLNEGKEKRTGEDLITTQKSRRVKHNNNHVETMNVMNWINIETFT